MSILKSYNRFVLINNNFSCFSLKRMKKNGMSECGIRKLIDTKSFYMTSDDYRRLQTTLDYIMILYFCPLTVLELDSHGHYELYSMNGKELHEE